MIAPERESFKGRKEDEFLMKHILTIIMLGLRLLLFTLLWSKAALYMEAKISEIRIFF